MPSRDIRIFALVDGGMRKFFCCCITKVQLLFVVTAYTSSAWRRPNELESAAGALAQHPHLRARGRLHEVVSLFLYHEVVTLRSELGEKHLRTSRATTPRNCTLIEPKKTFTRTKSTSQFQSGLFEVWPTHCTNTRCGITCGSGPVSNSQVVCTQPKPGTWSFLAACSMQSQ